jgi:hypothetical protein
MAAIQCRCHLTALACFHIRCVCKLRGQATLPLRATLSNFEIVVGGGIVLDMYNSVSMVHMSVWKVVELTNTLALRRENEDQCVLLDSPVSECVGN